MLDGVRLYDIETAGGFSCDVVCAVSSDLSGRDVRHYSTGAEMAEDMRRTGGRWIAYNGGKFDTLVAMRHLGPPADAILSGSSVLLAHWPREGRKRPALYLGDALPWFLCSLAKLGAAHGLPKLGDDLDVEHLEREPRAKVVEYCARDVEVLRVATVAALKDLDDAGARPRWTAGAAGVELLRVLEPDTWAAMEAHTLSLGTLRRLLGHVGVRGGRTECLALGTFEGVHGYDVHSSYPARWLENRLPVGFGDNPKISPALYHVSWYRTSRETPAPVLGDMGHGTGPLEAWMTPEELECLSLDKSVTWSRINEALRPAIWIDAGQRHAAHLFALKEAGGHPHAKVWLNGTTGKTGQDPWKPRSVLVDGWTYRDEYRTPHVEPYMQPLLAATVTGRARAALWRAWHAVEEAGGRVYNGDTDSCHCDLPPAAFAEALASCGQRMGPGCGEWGHEWGPAVGAFAGAKLYGIKGVDDKGREVVKVTAKGVRGGQVGSRDLDFDDLATMADGGAVRVVKRGMRGWRSLVGSVKRRVDELPEAGRTIEREVQRVLHHRASDSDSGRVFYL